MRNSFRYAKNPGLTPATATAPPAPLIAAASTDRWYAGDAATLRYREQGSGPPVLLVHGWTLDLDMWSPQLAALGSSYRVISVDRRGFGLSPGQPSSDRDGDDLQALCHHLSLGRVALVGMSQGARAVLNFAIAAPQQVACLVLDGPPDLLDSDATDATARDEYRALVRAEGIDAFRRAWINHPLVRLRTRDPSVHRTLRAIIDRYPGRDLAAPVSDTAGNPRPEQLASLQIPALVITGEHDMAERIGAADALARLLPRAERAIIADAGHLPNLDNPVAYNAVVRAFLGHHASASG
jgi:pimeloyl-ACP methyl ester carboxylesterase